MKKPFDPETEFLYCSRCGLKLEKSSHMFSQFLMCPRHGEFTMAPVVMKEDDSWFIELTQTEAGMWETCKYLDSQHENGEPWNEGESRVIMYGTRPL